MDRKYFLSTKDLVTIAILSALGGGLSVYVGYLGNLVNRVVGVPFGAGQFMAGLHVIWIVLAVGITKKKGVGTATGLLKGVVELFLGGTHGVVIVVVSLVQGLLVDAVLFKDSTKENRGLMPYCFAGGISAASNVFIFQAFFFAGVPIVLISMLGMLAFASGIIFGGYVSLQMMDSLEQGGLIYSSRNEKKDTDKPVYIRYGSVIVTVIFLISFTVGGVYYFHNVYEPPGSESISIIGEVDNEYEFVYDDFQDQEVVVFAELEGSVTYEPPRNYTGIPLNVILSHAEPRDGATKVRVIATDGYDREFDLESVVNDDEVIISFDDGEYRIVVDSRKEGYTGSDWVRDISRIEVS